VAGATKRATRYHPEKKGDHMRLLIQFTASLALALWALLASAQTADVPKHLAIARELVTNIAPENDHYHLGGQSISMPGDLFSNKYAMTADCSGFLLAVFDRAGYTTRSKMLYLKSSISRKRPVAEDFVLSIEQEKGYRRIKAVEDMRPGDLLAHAMLNVEDQKQTSTTGHVFLVNSVPREITPRKPLVEGTRQYEVSIIDSNEEHVGADDTRLKDPANKLTGLGTGTIRLYADANGELVGWARTFTGSNRFFSYSPQFPSDTKLRKAAIGRPV
jgi:hypothetical protein